MRGYIEPDSILPSGTEVKVSIRGKQHTAIIASVRQIKRRQKARNLAMRVTGDPNSLDQWVYQMVNETEDEWYEAGTTSVSPTGRTIDRMTAENRFREVRGKFDQARAEHRRARLNRAEENGLGEVFDGDEIEVQFKGGVWRKVIFRGFVSKSGNVRYEQHIRPGKTRTCSPKFARRVQEAGA